MLDKSYQVKANAVILSGGLVLILLGGCFMIGVMITLVPPIFNNNCNSLFLEPNVQNFRRVLYFLGFLCFGASFVLIVTAIRRLINI